MAIDKISLELIKSAPIKTYEQVQQGKPTTGTKAPGSFQELFGQAIHDVDSLQKDADTKIEGMITGKGNVSTHQAMIALEKADIAFQMMNQIRGKIVRAYEEVMRTQV